MITIQPITEEMIWERIPVRRPNSHKGSYGHVLAICGCSEYRGAAALCSLGALRSGTGLLTLAAPENVIQSMAGRIPEAIFLPLEQDRSCPETSAPSSASAAETSITVASASAAAADRSAVFQPPTPLIKAIEKASVTAIGCGKQADEETYGQICQVMHHAKGTIVLDAGALTCISACDGAFSRAAVPASDHASDGIPSLPSADFLRQASGRTIVTPHPGEMARLTGLPIPQILQMPAPIAKGYAEKSGAVVVLKGHRTLIAAPDGSLYQNQTGNPGLSRGGSGDLLTGMIAGLAAQGLSPIDAAICGVWLHGAAADRCAARKSMMGMLPEDILEDLCRIFLEHGR